MLKVFNSDFMDYLIKFIKKLLYFQGFYHFYKKNFQSSFKKLNVPL